MCKTATLKKTTNWFSRPIIAYAGQKYCKMLQQLQQGSILQYFDLIKLPFEPEHKISNNVVCATSKASDQPLLVA